MTKKYSYVFYMLNKEIKLVHNATSLKQINDLGLCKSYRSYKRHNTAYFACSDVKFYSPDLVLDETTLNGCEPFLNSL